MDCLHLRDTGAPVVVHKPLDELRRAAERFVLYAMWRGEVVTHPIKNEPKVDHVFASPGEIITVKLECNRCENRRWPAVNPMRNVARGLRRLDEGDEDGAREYFTYALELLGFLAQHTDEPPQPEERTEAVDRAEAALRQVEQLLPVRGSNAARQAVKNYFGKSA